MLESNTQQSLRKDENMEEFDLKSNFLRYANYWYWFVLSVVLSVGCVFIYLRYTPSVFHTNATIIIKDENNSSSTSASEAATFIDLGVLGGMSSNKIENEIGILKSRRMMSNVVDALGANITYYHQGDIQDVEVYENKPINVEILNIIEDSLDGPKTFNIKFLNDSIVTLVNQDSSREYSFRKGESKNIGFADMIINFSKPSLDYYVTINSVQNVSKQLASKLKVNLVDDNSSLLELSVNSSIPAKYEDVLNQLIFEYNKEAITDKNLVARNTRDFIDERLKIINEELDSVEFGKENFKENNRLTDIQAESELFIQNASDYNSKLLEVNTQLQLVNDMIGYLEEDNKGSTLPSNLGFEGESINDQISEYNNLVLQRNRILNGSTDENPVVLRLNSQIIQTEGIVMGSLQRLRKNLLIAKNDLDRKSTEISSEISSIPSKERKFRGIVRQQDIKERLYLYLLQKREENSLSLAVKSPKAKVVDNAYTVKDPVSPNKSFLYFFGISLGLVLPFSVLYLTTLLRTSVRDKAELTKISSGSSVIGELPNIKKGDSDLIQENDRSILAEAFRMLLTNLQYLLVEKIRSGEEGITTFVTSTVKGEGKTFVSFNLAMTMANTGKKVLIVGADLRNPQLQRYQKGAKQMLGLSDYLVDGDLSVEEVVRSSELNKNLEFLPSGSIPPNPSELLQLKRTDALFGELRSKYDYIIVDTAPSMVVADTFLINHLADVTIHVVRAKYTDRKLVQFAVDSKREGKLKNLAFVLNDVDSADFGYYGSKYGYAYGYGNHQESFLSKIKNRFR